MTSRDVHPDDMFDDPVVDAFARDVREAAATTPAPVPDAALATIFRDGLPAVPEPNRSPARRTRRRRAALRGAVAGLVAGLGVGGLGVAGALPDPVQRQVVRAAKVIGVELPAPDHDVEVETDAPDDAPVTPATTVADAERRPPDSAPAVTAPGRVDDDEDDGVRGRGRGRGRSGEERDDRGTDDGAERSTTTSTVAGSTPTTIDEDDELRGDDELDEDRRGRNRGHGGDDEADDADDADDEDLG